jgi:hypothetical protein
MPAIVGEHLSSVNNPSRAALPGPSPSSSLPTLEAVQNMRKSYMHTEPVPVPGRQWLRYLCDTSSFPLFFRQNRAQDRVR